MINFSCILLAQLKSWGKLASKMLGSKLDYFGTQPGPREQEGWES